MTLFAALAVAAAWVDGRTRRLPNALMAAMALVAAAVQTARLLAPGAVASLPWTARLEPSMGTPLSCLLGSAVLVAAAAGAELLLRSRLSVSAVGMGDVKLLGAWSLMVGPVAALACFAAGLALGAVVAALRHRPTFPVGPWVCGACLVYASAALWGPVLVSMG